MRYYHIFEQTCLMLDSTNDAYVGEDRYFAMRFALHIVIVTYLLLFNNTVDRSKYLTKLDRDFAELKDYIGKAGKP